MSICNNTDHNKFKGVLFAKNGCLACQCEEFAQEKKTIQYKYDVLLALIKDIRVYLKSCNDLHLRSTIQQAIRNATWLQAEQEDFIVVSEKSWDQLLNDVVKLTETLASNDDLAPEVMEIIGRYNAKPTVPSGPK